MIHWITAVTTMLIVVSNAAACDGRKQRKLRKHAAWLIAVLPQVPDDEETVKFVENFRMTETLFEAAVDARRRGCPELADDMFTRFVLALHPIAPRRAPPESPFGARGPM